MGEHQWYVHLSREPGADLTHIKSVIRNLRRVCVDQGINLTVCLGPTLLADLTKDIPNDFQPFETIKSIDGSGREVKGTQEELLFWMNSPPQGSGLESPVGCPPGPQGAYESCPGDHDVYLWQLP